VTCTQRIGGRESVLGAGAQILWGRRLVDLWSGCSGWDLIWDWAVGFDFVSVRIWASLLNQALRYLSVAFFY
jgi:hypothetical protein